MNNANPDITFVAPRRLPRLETRRLVGAPARALRGLAGRHAPWLDRIAVGILCLVLLVSVVGAFWRPADPYTANPKTALLGPSAHHLFGTDDVGRDVLSRMLAGAPETLLAALGITLLATLVGVVLASVAALSPRWLDAAVMRLCDITLALPTLVLALGIAAALGPSNRSLTIAMVLSLWPGTARLARTTIRETMSQPYIETARRMGAGRLSLLFRHILPNSLDQIVVTASMEIGGAIVIMAGLAFIGVGAPPPDANWGSMVAEGQSYMTTAWWISMFPGLVITLSAMAFGVIGDAIRVRIDPAMVR
ncbi:ABC transporter permease [Pseudofrankia inefficax]|uniref:Binding-protein-dependent transport systems inner membrane component n=1 Tax=Pseudofrankia inefficax (strain DSM 45817 / CECT 9037 / DDB 130130 / EuI1c) TaxID=298654 RepID=E3J7G8_PSEI1|nr:ABC transporter permease [Pseudofrankia inefficax]ADP79577.1 binding-protein-dependent transport systems inner membrane component [Pseudofrankia inefficax]